MRTRTSTHTPTHQEDIEAKKASIRLLFSDFWFRIPDYQRSYVWGQEQISELMDDLLDALQENPNKEYFLGSIVLQKFQETNKGITYASYDVLDGQQRLTTLLLLMAVLRDMSPDNQLTKNTRKAIYQERDPYVNQPERIRIKFLIRDEVGSFIDKYVKKEGGTQKTSGLKKEAKSENISIAQMASNLLDLRTRLEAMEEETLLQFAIFLFTKVHFIYVSSETLEDAFKLFTILNSRGIPLTTSDILKSINIGAIPDENGRRKYAKAWETLETNYGRANFDRFLEQIRTIVLKEKVKEDLLKEYEKIYRQGKLNKGVDTLRLILDCQKIYNKYIKNDYYLFEDSYRLSNLLTTMKQGFTNMEDWKSPFLAYCNKFHDKHLFEFTERLESKFLADWMLQLTPTQRRKNLYAILKAIDKTDNAEDLVINRKIFTYDKELIEKRLQEPIYKAAYCRHMLLKLEYLLKDHHQSFPAFHKPSIEHVYPQRPKANSKWRKDFASAKSQEWLHKLANLVLLSRRKNSKLNNKDFAVKKKDYFQSSINIFPNVNKVMQYKAWTPRILKKRQVELVELLMQGFK